MVMLMTPLVAVVLSPGERVAVSESMNRDLNRVSVWCNLVAGAIAGEIMSVIYLRFVLANRIYVEAQRILLCGKSKNSHFYYFNKLKQARTQ